MKTLYLTDLFKIQEFGNYYMITKLLTEERYYLVDDELIEFKLDVETSPLEMNRLCNFYFMKPDETLFDD